MLYKYIRRYEQAPNKKGEIKEVVHLNLRYVTDVSWRPDTEQIQIGMATRAACIVLDGASASDYDQLVIALEKEQKK